MDSIGDDIVHNGAPSPELFPAPIRSRSRRREGGDGGRDGGGAAARRSGAGGALLVAGVRELAGGGAAFLAAGAGRLRGGGAADSAGVSRRHLGLYGVEGPLRIEPMDRAPEGLRGVPSPRHDVHAPNRCSGSRAVHC